MQLRHRSRCRTTMARKTIFFLVALSSVSSSSTAEKIECVSGWTQEHGSPSVKIISPEQINDGYCDCPLDGLDERETGACAGSMDGGWAGVKPAGDVKESPYAYFSCPQQKSLFLPLSRINDGVCDCCDGSDEPPSSNCKDECYALLAGERAARAKIAKTFAEGSRRRKKDMDLFQQLLKTTVEQIEELTTKKIPAAEQEMETLKKQMEDQKRFYSLKRLQAATQVGSILVKEGHDLQRGGYKTGLFETMEQKDVLKFIVSACQLAGELVDADTSAPDWKRQLTCMPLRLAGLDYGIIWEGEHFSEGTASVTRVADGGNRDAMDELGNLHRMVAPDGAGLYFDSSGKSPKKPAQDQEYMLDDEYDHYHDHEDHYFDDDEDDDYPDRMDNPEYRRREKERRERRKRLGKAKPEIPKGDDAKPGVKDTILASVKAMPFYLPRASFKPRAEPLLSSIDSLLGLGDDDDEEEGEDEGEEDYDPENEPAFDPIAAQMARGALSRRLSHIERGEYFASSAIILLDTLQQAMEKAGDSLNDATFSLKLLAVGTLHHGNISSEDVAEILYPLIPEYKMSDIDNDTCVSYFSSMCPPRSKTLTTSDGSSDTYPPDFVLSAAEARCKERDLSSQVCFDGESSDQTDIPDSVPDGYYNYFVPHPRSEDDYLVEISKPLRLSLSIGNMEEEYAELENEVTDLKTTVDNLENKIGGRDSPMYGADGELYGIKDECVSLEVGKYVYEVCFFGKASQKENHSSTSLGKWAGMEKDKNTGERIMKWTDGAKCWNGPKRSVEARVTCGKETKVLTADEPDTCRYVLTMESHIACDDDFKSLHEL